MTTGSVPHQAALSDDRPRYGEPPRLGLLGALMVGALVGAATGLWPSIGIALAAGLCFVTLTARDLTLALCCWIPMLFLEGVPAFNLVGKVGGLVIFGAWAYQVTRGGTALRGLLDSNRRIVTTLLLLLAWTTGTVLWAADERLAAADLLRWYAVVVLFLVVATMVRDLTAVRRVCMSFVVGGLLAVALSLLEGRGAAAGTSASRLGDAAGDPNFLGAWLLAAMVLTLGLLPGVDTWGRRVLFAGLLVPLGAGLGLTLSRGAFLATGLTAVLAFLVLKGRRVRALQAAVVAGVCVIGWLSSSPRAWERLTRNEGGSGRADLWTVAWRMVQDRPLTGVGPDNFTTGAADYLREVGPIRTSYLVAGNNPDEVHNAYLQTLVDGGAPALLLLLLFVAGCLVLTFGAARRLDRLGLRAQASLVYGVLLAQSSLLATAFFLSSAVDKRLWLVLALGPAVDVASRSLQRTPP